MFSRVFNGLPSAAVWCVPCRTKGVLRITLSTSDKVTLKLEGRLVGPWVDELRAAVLRTSGSRMPLELDVGDLTFADDDGEQALLWLYRMGAQFRGDGSFSDYLCKRLAIPLLSRKRAPRK